MPDEDFEVFRALLSEFLTRFVVCLLCQPRVLLIQARPPTQEGGRKSLSPVLRVHTLQGARCWRQVLLLGLLTAAPVTALALGVLGILLYSALPRISVADGRSLALLLWRVAGPAVQTVVAGALLAVRVARSQTRTNDHTAAQRRRRRCC